MTEVTVLAVLAGESYVCGEAVTLPDDVAAQLVRESRAELVQRVTPVGDLQQRRSARKAG